MATKFLEPGGDATFNVALTTSGGLWGAGTTGAAIATDIVHGSHIKSIESHSTGGIARTPTGIVADAGSRISFYFYAKTLPNATATIASLLNSIGTSLVTLRLTSGGVLQLWNGTSVQIGTNGATLSTGQWYRISLAYTITSTSVNRFELFVNGASSISITNATLTNVTTSSFQIGNSTGNATADYRYSDIYIDDSNSLTDPGNIWVTAKRPNANGALNEWTTQIGSGGSGYGTGHSPQVNERALSTTNGWSFQNAAKKVEEYTIESAATGDIDISSATIVDFLGWVSTKVGSASTGNIIVAGAASNISVSTSFVVITKIAGSTTYPSSNAAIGMDNNTVNQLFSLAECGIIVAFIPATVYTQILTETLTITDTIVKGPAKVLSEILTITDTLLKTPSKIFTETLTLTDSFLKTCKKIVSETLSLTDTLLKTPIKHLLETLTLSDTFTKLRTTFITLTETLALTDNLNKLIGKVQTETLVLTDALNKTTQRLFTEIIILTDSLTRLVKKVFTEEFTLLDTIKKLVNGLIPIFSNKFNRQNTSYNDKLSPRNSEYGDKFSSRDSSYNDKFTHLQ